MADKIDFVLRSDRRAVWEPYFWPKIQKGDPDACWEWTASRRDGYGRFKAAGSNVSAHRLAYTLEHGKSPGRLSVCHRCDNPPCCNPAHLFLGTTQDNTRDMVAKGRHRQGESKGEKNGNARLRSSDVDAIRRRILAGETNVAIARDYPVSHYVVSRIRRGRSWGNEAMQPRYASLRTYPVAASPA